MTHVTPSPEPESEAIVFGAGPAGLMAALRLAEGGAKVVVMEKLAAPARRFLMAGRGGLNLTHSEPLTALKSRYGAAGAWLGPMIDAFPPRALRDFADHLGAETFIGSSGRVFPKVLKASPLLRAWLNRLEVLGVRIHTRHEWQGFDEDRGHFVRTEDGIIRMQAKVTVLALGGAAWVRLGGHTDVLRPLAADMIPLAPFQSSNMGVMIGWSPHLRAHFAGQALKNVGLRLGPQSLVCEVMLTATGLEGTGIYALSASIRDALRAGPVRLELDLKPDLPVEVVATRLAARREGLSLSNHLRRALKLDPVAIALLHESRSEIDAAMIKALPLTVTGHGGLERAISCAGGVMRESFTPDLSMIKRPGVFVCGEMLDWEAPTGGYLLQACFSSGHVAGLGALKWLQSTQNRA